MPHHQAQFALYPALLISISGFGVDSPGVVDQPCPAQPERRYAEGRRATPRRRRAGPRLRRAVRRPGVAPGRQPVVRDARRSGRRCCCCCWGRTAGGLYCVTASSAAGPAHRRHSSRVDRHRQKTYVVLATMRPVATITVATCIGTHEPNWYQYIRSAFFVRIKCF